MDIGQLKRKLSSYREEEIRLSFHGKVREIWREVSNESVVAALKNPDNMEYFTEQKAKYEGERKYDLYFRLSNARYLRLVVACNKVLNVVTAIILHRKLPMAKRFR